jgi:hypothetical protein
MPLARCCSGVRAMRSSGAVSRTASPVPSSTRKNWSRYCTSVPLPLLDSNAMTTYWQFLAV